MLFLLVVSAQGFWKRFNNTCEYRAFLWRELWFGIHNYLLSARYKARRMNGRYYASAYAAFDSKEFVEFKGYGAVEANADALVLHRELRDTIHGMPESRSKQAVLLYLKDASLSDAAAEMSLTSKGYLKALYRAVAYLRDCLHVQVPSHTRLNTYYFERGSIPSGVQRHSVKVISQQLLRCFSVEQQGAIREYYEGGKSAREIAKAIGRPVGTVKTWIRKFDTQ